MSYFCSESLRTERKIELGPAKQGKPARLQSNENESWHINRFSLGATPLEFGARQLIFRDEHVISSFNT